MHEGNLAQTQRTAGTQCIEGFCSSLESTWQLICIYKCPAAHEAEWALVLETKATLERKRKDCSQCLPMGLLNQSWPLSPTCAVVG